MIWLYDLYYELLKKTLKHTQCGMFNSRRRYVVLWYLIHRVKLQMCDQSIVLLYL